jgi:hypothetical protein
MDVRNALEPICPNRGSEHRASEWNAASGRQSDHEQPDVLGVHDRAGKRELDCRPKWNEFD